MRRTLLLVFCLSLPACQSSRAWRSDSCPDSGEERSLARPLETEECRKIDNLAVEAAPAPRSFPRPGLRMIAVQTAGVAIQQAARNGGDWRVVAGVALLGLAVEAIAHLPDLWLALHGA